MADETLDAGNVTPPDDGPGAEPETRNAETEADRNASENDNQRALNKALQASVAQARAESAQLKAQLEQMSRPQSPAANGNDPRAERLEKVRGYASGAFGEQDPVAAELLALREENAMWQGEVMNLRELDKISDEDERNETLQHFNSNRHRLGDVKAARAEIRSSKLETQLKEQQEREDKLRKALEATSKRQNPDVVATHNREVSATEHQTRQMTNADWSVRQAELTRQYDAGNLEAGKTLRREQVQRSNGKINVKD